MRFFFKIIRGCRRPLLVNISKQCICLRYNKITHVFSLEFVFTLVYAYTLDYLNRKWKTYLLDSSIVSNRFNLNNPHRTFASWFRSRFYRRRSLAPNSKFTLRDTATVVCNVQNCRYPPRVSVPEHHGRHGLLLPEQARATHGTVLTRNCREVYGDSSDCGGIHTRPPPAGDVPLGREHLLGRVPWYTALPVIFEILLWMRRLSQGWWRFAMSGPRMLRIRAHLHPFR